MIDNLKIAAKIGASSALKWSIIFGLGVFVTAITLFVCLFTNSNLAGGGHGSEIALFFGLLSTNIAAFILIFGSPVFLVLYFLLANKTSIQNAIYLMWKYKAEGLVSTTVNKVAQTITQKEGWRKELSDAALAKAKLWQASKENPETPRWQRRILKSGFNKIRLNDIDFNDEKVSLSEVLILKLTSFFSKISKPSFTLLWLLIGIQLSIFIFSFI